MQQRSAQGAHSLPGDFYTSDLIFRREQERLFKGGWTLLGHCSRLPEEGSYFLHQIGQESLLVLRDREGLVRGFHNVCRHRGSRLCTAERGQLGGAVRCPYHAWTYSLDGRLIGAPHMGDTAGFRKEDHPLTPVTVEEVGGLLALAVAAPTLSAAEYLAPLAAKLDAWRLAELEVVASKVYAADANWKLFFQNYSECYHCPTVHPVLERLTPYRDTDNDLDEGPILGGPMYLTTGNSTMSMDGSAVGRALNAEAGGRVFYYTLFPNLFLSLHPDYVLLHRLEPLGPAATRVTCQWLCHPETVADPDFDIAGAVDFWHMTNEQDWALCVGVQQGVASSAYRPGPYSDLESQVAAFDRQYRRAMGEADT